MRYLNPTRTLLMLALLGGAGMLAGCQHHEQGGLQLATYPEDYRVRHPILVTPTKASVPSECGTWREGEPGAIGGVGFAGNENVSHWNFGCASQHNLAAMIDNPNDLLESRPEGQPDAARRQQVLSTYRQGEKSTMTKHESLIPHAQIRTQVK